MARRSGEIAARGDRKWLVRWFLGADDNGKKRYKSKMVHGTKRDAQRLLNTVLRDRDLGTYVEPAKITLDAHLDRWLETMGKAVSVRTLVNMRSILAKHVRPVLGSRPLQGITPKDVQQMIDGMSGRAGRELSPRTHQLARRYLSQALIQAVEWNMLARNPAQKVKLPKLTTREKRALSADEVRRFREAAKGTKHSALWDFLLDTGCRPGEALGLRWRDLDLEVGQVLICQALTKGEKGRPMVGPPKTDSSVRTIPLTRPVVAVLREHRRRQAERALRLGEFYDRDLDLVFANDAGRPLNEANLRARFYKPACVAAGIEGVSGPYDLRHTVATQLLELGENPKVVSERLGHSSTEMTLDVYGHVLPGMQERATKRLEEALFGNSSAG
jgi:integrase